MQEESATGWDPRQLARLLGVGEDNPLPDDPADRDRLAAELLREHLAGPVVVDASAGQALSAILDHPPAEHAPSQARTLSDTLLDPATPVAALREVKDYYREVAEREESRPNRGPEHAAAVAVYYAAIAAALVSHGEKITSFSCQDLAGYLDDLLTQPWTASLLKDLLERAKAICLRQAE